MGINHFGFWSERSKNPQRAQDAQKKGPLPRAKFGKKEPEKLCQASSL